MTTPKQRLKLLELAEQATPRPWDPVGETGSLRPEFGVWTAADDKKICIRIGNADMADEITFNMRYIAAACNLAPELVKEVEELTAHVEKAEAERDVLAKLIASNSLNCPGCDDDCPYDNSEGDIKCWIAWAAKASKE